jgi:Domain of unknown function (DUF4158)
VPGRVFTESERRRLDAFPSEIVESDPIRYFTLLASDLELVRQQRGDHNRLGFALQLCVLRYLGFCPDDLVTAPPAAISFVADQLQVIPAALRAYGARPQTRTGHSQQIQRYLDFTTQRARTYVRWPTGYWHALWNTTSRACCFS